MNGKKPVKSKKLKVLDYKGTLYATFDGSSIWKLDKISFGLLKLCEGNKTLEQIIKQVAEKAKLNVEDVRGAVMPIFDELTKMKFIEWID